MTNRKVYPQNLTKYDSGQLKLTQDNFEIASKKQNLTSITINNTAPNLPSKIQFEQLKNDFYFGIQQLKDTRIVEKLGSRLLIEQKQDELLLFEIQFQEFLRIFNQINDLVYKINFDDKSPQYKNDNSIQLMKDIQELEIVFLDLVNFSSLRYLNICCEIFQLDSSNIQLDYPVSEWSNRLREYIYCKDIKKIPKKVKNSKGFCEQMCSCFFSDKDENSKKKKQTDLLSSNNLTSHVSLTKVSNMQKKDLRQDIQFSQQILLPNSKQNSNLNFTQQQLQ